MRDLITVTEAAAILGIVPRVVRYHISKGHLAAVVVNERLMLLDRSEVQSFKPGPAGFQKKTEKKPRRKA